MLTEPNPTTIQAYITLTMMTGELTGRLRAGTWCVQELCGFQSCCEAGSTVWTLRALYSRRHMALQRLYPDTCLEPYRCYRALHFWVLTSLCGMPSPLYPPRPRLQSNAAEVGLAGCSPFAAEM